jgi:hypothetical protein
MAPMARLKPLGIAARMPVKVPSEPMAALMPEPNAPLPNVFPTWLAV